ncbi:hypothetical protein FM106_11545 [Brachybacterium faecium]|nr:hypothetical protein FM106_11545 [Brachybacterium faecium]
MTAIKAKINSCCLPFNILYSPTFNLIKKHSIYYIVTLFRLNL